MEKKSIIIDNDGGTDDFVAILYAFLSKKFDVKGITLVAGNTSVDNVKQNVFKALEMAGITPEKTEEFGVYLPEYVNENIISDGAQGNNGLGGVKFKSAKGYKTKLEAAEDILVRTINENPGQISIVATGPLTNIARAIDKDSNFIKNVDELVIMSGDEGRGNITPYAEFNIYQDPDAAKKVFEAGFKKITMIGFNITKEITLCPEIEEFLKQNGGELGKFIYDITRTTANLDRGKNKVDGASMNDVLTLLYLSKKGKIFKTKKAHIDVDTTNNETRGRTNIVDSSGNETTCNVVTSVDGERILRDMLTTLFPSKEKEIEELLEERYKRQMFREYAAKQIPSEAEKIRELLNSEGARKKMREIEKYVKEKKENRQEQGEGQ